MSSVGSLSRVVETFSPTYRLREIAPYGRNIVLHGHLPEVFRISDVQSGRWNDPVSPTAAKKYPTRATLIRQLIPRIARREQFGRIFQPARQGLIGALLTQVKSLNTFTRQQMEPLDRLPTCSSTRACEQDPICIFNHAYLTFRHVGSPFPPAGAQAHRSQTILRYLIPINGALESKFTRSTSPWEILRRRVGQSRHTLLLNELNVARCHRTCRNV
jgi:hypothetical protein